MYHHRGVLVRHKIRHPEREFAPWSAATARDGVTPVFLRGAGIQNDDRFTALLTRVQFLRVHSRHVMHHFHFFPKILAGDIDTPFGTVALTGPAIGPACEHADIAIAHACEGRRGERRPAAIIVTDDHRCPWIGHQTLHAKFHLTPRHQAGTWNVGTVVFTDLAHINAGARGLMIQHLLEISWGNRLHHRVGPP